MVNIQSGFTSDISLSHGKFKLSRIETISDGVIDDKRIGFTNDDIDNRYKINIGDILYSNINSLSHIGKVAIYQKDINL
ncbi:hypothetical protein N8E87_11225 [Avibacterium paragallinarum]|uniref:hypothetical protein n=1 Tax=Avibacterium paragallinarum TaxID=728 RepID=UPI0021F7E4CD|nr:hypothetical protein [Avibacterium paragallinarum]UXN36717.1 hypothetical protein N8E87_11225 [Avibacterium paragallinarum]